MKKEKVIIRGEQLDLAYDVDPKFGGDEWLKVADWCIDNVKTDDTFFDVGAYLGFMSVAVLHFAKPKFTVVIEPDQRVIPLLEENLRPYEDYAVVPHLVLDQSAIQKFYLNLRNPAQNSIYARYDLEHKATIRCASATIDELIADFRIDGPVVLKIDVEFAEHLVWKGMIRSLPQIRAFIMEYQPEHMRKHVKINPNDFIEEIKKAGFETVFVTGTNLAFIKK